MSGPVTIIERQKKITLIRWKELKDYRDLLYFLVIRGVKAKYAQSVLGIGWAVLQPLFTMLIFTIVFGRLAKVSSDGVPYALFSFAALIPWTYFSGALTEASNSLVANANMLSKVYFPRLILPLSSLISKLLDFVITILVMAVLMAVYRYQPPANLAFIFLLIPLMLICTFGPAIILAAWSVQYRDIKYALSFMVQILMYCAPVVYPLSSVPSRYQLLYSLNPLVGVVEGFRSCLLGTNPMPWGSIAVSACISLVALVYGLYTFSKLEKTFADVA